VSEAEPKVEADVSPDSVETEAPGGAESQTSESKAGESEASESKASEEPGDAEAKPKPASEARAPSGAAPGDAPITSTVLRKAASSPDELLEIMREEGKAKARRAKAPPKQAPPRKAPDAAPPKPAAGPPKAAPAKQGQGQGGPKKGSRKPRVERASSIFASALTASGSGPIPEARPRSAQSRPASQPARPYVGSPSETGVLPPISSAGSGRLPGAAAGGTRIVLPKPSVLPVVATVGLVGLGVIVALFQVGHLLSGAVANRPAPSTVVHTQPQPAAASPQRPGGSYQLAAVGPGRVVQTTPEGHLIVLRADPTSGELEVERAYELVNDPDRHLGHAGLRRWHGYYLDDLDVSRQLSIEAAATSFEKVVAAAVRMESGLEDVEASALALARAGGADRLLPALESSGADRVEALRKHGAAIGLGRAGYLGAVPGVLELLEQHKDSARLRPLLTGILVRLSNLDLNPDEPGDTAQRVRVWWGSQSPLDPYERVKDR
jgi:hypothetical protein